MVWVNILGDGVTPRKFQVQGGMYIVPQQPYLPLKSQWIPRLSVGFRDQRGS